MDEIPDMVEHIEKEIAELSAAMDEAAETGNEVDLQIMQFIWKDLHEDLENAKKYNE